MSRLGRRLGRSVAVAGWTAGWFLIWIMGAVLTAIAPTWRRRWRMRCLNWWAGGILTVLGVTVTSAGRPPGDGPFLLVTNHLSYLDVIVLARQVRATFVAKREVRTWPVWGILARAMGTLFVDRERLRDTRRVSRAIEDVLDRGEGVVMFPEGTSTKGSTVAPFRSSLLAAASRRALPVHHASISYQTGEDDLPAHLAVCWWGDMEFAPHFWGLCGVGHVEASVRFGREPVGHEDRKVLARSLHQAVVNDFTPVVTADS